MSDNLAEWLAEQYATRGERLRAIADRLAGPADPEPEPEVRWPSADQGHRGPSLNIRQDPHPIHDIIESLEEAAAHNRIRRLKS